MAEDDANSMLAGGVLMCSIGTLLIVFRPVTKFERDSKDVEKIRKIWGMTKLETMPLVQGIVLVSVGALFVFTALAFKFAGAKP